MYLEQAEDKFAVLFTVKVYEAPIDAAKLIEIMTWEKQVMEYFELSEILFELSEDGYIEKTFYRNEEAYTLTAKGSEALNFFSDRVPPSVKERIKDAIGRMRYEEIVSPDFVKAEVFPSGENGADLRCSMASGGQLKLEMTVNYGDSKLAASLAADNFKENGQKIYAEILKLLNPEK